MLPGLRIATRPFKSLHSKRHLAHLIRPYRTQLVLGLGTVILGGAAGLAEPWPLKIVLDDVLKGKPRPGWINSLAFSLGGGNRFTILNIIVLAMAAIAVIGALCTYLEKYATITIGQKVGHDLRQELYRHIHRLSLDYHDNGRAGDLIGRLTSDIDAIESFISSGLLGIVMNCLTLLGMAVVMLCLSPRFTLIAFSVAPILLFVVFRYTRKIKHASREVRKLEGEVVSMIQEVLTSMRVVKAFASEEFEQRRLVVESGKVLEVGRRARTLKVRLLPLVDLIVSVGVCLVLWLGGKLALRGALSPGSLVLFIFYLGKLYKPMRDISRMADGYSRAAVGYERILEVMETEHRVREFTNATTAPRFRGRIEFANVGFGYHPSRPILRQLSFTVHPGQTVALVGPTGAGKTTIASLIPRFYDPDSGVVTIDGTDVRRFRQKSLRQQISLVLQDTVLFRGPVWYNIAYGKPDASREEVIRAAELANAAEFIEAMPDGYDSVIGERGVTLSGGQRQRIGIARAIIRNTPILILDEVTGLDTASETLVFQALHRLMEGRTSIVIAHRLITVQSADIIFVVNHGKLVESGKHDELLRTNGVYSELCRLQFCSDENSSEGRHATRATSSPEPLLF